MDINVEIINIKLESLNLERNQLISKIQELQNLNQRITSRINEVDGGIQVLQDLLNNNEDGGDKIDTEDITNEGTSTDEE